MEQDAYIYIAGHKGLVGSAILRKLESEGYTNLITRSHKELDLFKQAEVDKFFSEITPEFVFLAAAKVGGIWANNNYPAEFIYNNIMIQTNILHASFKTGIKKLLFLGSSCIYPRECPQPIKEEYLLSGELEPTNESYAIAKISGIKMCQSYNRQYGTNFISVMPTNLYGPGDNFDLETSHVLPALVRKFHKAKMGDKLQKTNDRRDKHVTIWGTGKPSREFLYVDDLADACLFLMNNYNSNEIINIGTGKDISIKKLAELIKDVVGFEGAILYDPSKPDGTPQKLLDCRKIESIGWRSSISLRQGIEMTYRWYMENKISNKIL